MKKGNFRTKRIYPEKGKIQFVIQTKVAGEWREFGNDKSNFTFETQEKADKVLISILDFGSKFKELIKFHGIDFENLKTGGEWKIK